MRYLVILDPSVWDGNTWESDIAIVDMVVGKYLWTYSHDHKQLTDTFNKIRVGKGNGNTHLSRLSSPEKVLATFQDRYTYAEFSILGEFDNEEGLNFLMEKFKVTKELSR